MTNEPLITIPEMSKLTGKNSRTIWRWWRKDKTFPAPLQINGRAIGFRSSDYQAWLNGEWQA
jgi:prophage regulatory protein